MKIQTKTTLLFTTLTAAVFIILAGTVYYFSNEFAHNDFYKRLELRAIISAKLHFEQGHISTQSFKDLQKQYLEKLPAEESFIIKVDSSGEPLPPVPSGTPVYYLKNIIKAEGETVYHQKGFLHFAGLLYKDKSGDFLVVESAQNTYGYEIIKRLKNILIITLVASVLVIYSVGLYFSRKTFQPFRYITNKVVTISETNLHLRLKEQKGSDEIAELIRTFNNMFDRLETAFETQNNFVSNASHELRTPLTSIVAEADYALSRERNADDYRQSLASIVKQAEKLQQLTGGLLSLAQTTFDGKKQRWEKLRIDELLIEAKAHTNAVFNNRIIIEMQNLPDNAEDITILGNYDLLKIAIGNIMLNACKYSGTQPVTVQLAIDVMMVRITIKDQGIGIPLDDLKHIYEPFFRASNVRGVEGYGIGMPLSFNIIRMHKGNIVVESVENKGTTVIISLPVC